MSKFHWKHGWFFDRLEDGSVEITQSNGQIAVMAVIDPASWASIVAHVSAKSETSGSFQAAERLHAGEFDNPVRVGV